MALAARAQVQAVQSALAQRGYDPGAVDGVIGPATHAAMQRAADDVGMRLGDDPDEKLLEELLVRLDARASSSVRPAPTKQAAKHARPEEPKPEAEPEAGAAGGEAGAVVGEETQTLLDRPADADQLGRLAFARVLALRLRDARNAYYDPGTKKLRAARPGPFMLHLHGAWGSGKSSLLGLLAQELREPALPGPDGAEPAPWVVVQFNAWQHQRIAPPWWWLMATVYLEGKRELARSAKRAWLRFQVADAWWRIKHGWRNLAGVLLGLAVIASVAWLVWKVVHHKDPGTWLNALAAVATPLGAIFGIGLTIWGVTRGVRDWLLVRSAAGAREGLARGHDPLATVKSRFEHLAAHLGRPLAVVIDDLDRCQPTYVVELLEGIQTLFADAPVAYVVAADGAWIRDSFEDVYASFLDMPSEPGRPLGYHFLEKTFQLSAEIPRPSDDLRRRYFRGLLGLSSSGDGGTASGAAQAAASASTDEELRGAVASARTPQEEAAAVEAALVRAQSAELRRHTEHRLQDFDGLLELNPRAMKRLVNAYGLARDVEFVEAGGGIAQNAHASEQLALWTIVRLRWPLLARHLEAHPDDVVRIGRHTTAKSVPEELRDLFADPDVAAVVRGRGVKGDLDEDAIRRLTKRQKEPR